VKTAKIVTYLTFTIGVIEEIFLPICGTEVDK
jgi:hypothetical protein